MRDQAMTHYDALETRSADERAAALAKVLPEQIARAKGLPGYGEALAAIDPAEVAGPEALTRLPVLRKSELSKAQGKSAPLGGYAAPGASHVFQSPGPIYEPGRMDVADWWRIGRFLHAAGIGRDDVVQNCFAYHFTPAGHMFEAGARAVGATVFPAGTGQTELQVRAAADIGATAFAGTPDYLKVILDKAEEMGARLKFARAAVGGGALFPSLRKEYAERGIACLQCYATADLGNIAYESPAMEGMIVDEGVIVEIVRPGTGDPVAEGEVGEVVVTTFNKDYPLVRFGTGDLSAVLPGPSPCGRSNTRLKGWMGRADQTTKVRAMFVTPKQVNEVLRRHPEVTKARLVVEGETGNDRMTLRCEANDRPAGLVEAIVTSIRDVTKLRGEVELVAPGSLPNDGKVIEDLRKYD
jgi:phenylacetate-CoA ligase